MLPGALNLAYLLSSTWIHRNSGWQEIDSFLTKWTKPIEFLEVTTMARILKYLFHSSPNIYAQASLLRQLSVVILVYSFLMLITLILPTKGFPSDTFDLLVTLAARKTAIESSGLLVN